MKPKVDWLRPMTSALLWSGTLSLWAAVGLGLLAEKTAPHVPLAWEVLYEHRVFAFWTAGVFSGLSIGWIFFRRKSRLWLFFIWLLALGLLGVTGFRGGQLVFEYGMGMNL